MSSFSPEKLKDHHPQKKECQSGYFLLDFLFFFECFNNWGEVDSREDRRESWALAYSDIGVEDWRWEVVPGVCSGSIGMIAVKEAYNISIKSSFL